MTHGTITSIRPNRGDGRGFGRIALDGGGPALSFDNASAEGGLQALGRVLGRLWRRDTSRGRPFDRLRVGQRVTFAVGVDPRQAQRAYAEQLRPQAGPLRAFDCGCGERLGGADTAALRRVARAHVARAHPGTPLTDAQLGLLLAVEAYTVGAGATPPRAQQPTARPVRAAAMQP